MRWGIYIHIPFCRQKCFYCDFPSFAGRENRMEAYTNALCREISAQGTFIGSRQEPAATVYIGGGTPTMLSMSELTAIVCALRKAFPIAVDAEFTMEANPGTVGAGELKELRELGINRLSFGVQSFDDALLRRIGRVHTAAQAFEAVENAQIAGFKNLSLDLMYGLPGQTLGQLENSVETASSLGVQHISIYGLQLEEDTVFARQRDMGRLVLPSEETAEAMYDYMTVALPQHGYMRYEISNFARPGFESRHNLGYWQNVPYLGLGAAAHSYTGEQRLANITDIDSYIQLLAAQKSPALEEEKITRKIAMEEFAFLALRTTQGIDKKAFETKFGCSLASVYREVIHRMKEKGLLEEKQNHVHLTRLGMKYGNIVFEEFML